MVIDDDKDPLIMFARANQPKSKKKTSRKNKSPEKDLCEKEIMPWLKANAFCCTVIEAKSTFSASVGKYIKSQAVPGFPDIVGNDSDGVAVYIELKAPGRISTLRDNQRRFLKKKIYSNCFGIVVDSVDKLQTSYEQWKCIDKKDKKIDYLLSLLP